MRTSVNQRRKRHFVSLPPECYERLKRYAEEQQITVKALVEAVLHDVGKDGS